MTRALAVALLMSLGVAGAPFQCGGGKSGPERRLEDEPAQGLYDLAQQFHAAGNEKARAETLEFIVKRYPSSRFAEAARVELGRR